MSNFRHIEVRRNGAVHVVHFREHKILNDMVIEKVGQEMFSVAADEECKNLLLHFSNVGFLSSSVLGKLITLNKRLKAKEGKLKATIPTPNPAESTPPWMPSNATVGGASTGC